MSRIGVVLIIEPVLYPEDAPLQGLRMRLESSILRSKMQMSFPFPSVHFLSSFKVYPTSLQRLTALEWQDDCMRLVCFSFGGGLDSMVRFKRWSSDGWEGGMALPSAP